MTDRTPTEARRNSERLLAKGDRLAYDAPNDAGTAPPPVDWAHRAARGIICDLCDRKAIKWGFENVDEDIRAEIVDAMSDIIRAASPPAPAAEPVAFTYRNWRGEVSERHVRIIGIRFGFTEWHPEPQLLLRAFDLDKGEEREFAVNDIGPYPLDAAAIRAEADESADRQWCEGAKTAVSMLDPLVIGVDMWPQSAQAKYRAALGEIDRLIATRRSAIIESRRERRALADKGEAEPTEEPVVVFRPQRGSLAEAMRDRVAFYSIEAFRRHVLNEWPLCGSIAVEPYGGIDKRIGWDTHLVSVDGMAVGFTDRAIPDPAADPTWLPEAEAPVGVWCRTRRNGEAGENVCRLHVSPDGDREWIEHATGRTTVTHHSFAAPTHVTPLSGNMT